MATATQQKPQFLRQNKWDRMCLFIQKKLKGNGKQVLTHEALEPSCNLNVALELKKVEDPWLQQPTD